MLKQTAGLTKMGRVKNSDVRNKFGIVPIQAKRPENQIKIARVFSVVGPLPNKSSKLDLRRYSLNQRPGNNTIIQKSGSCNAVGQMIERRLDYCQKSLSKCSLGSMLVYVYGIKKKIPQMHQNGAKGRYLYYFLLQKQKFDHFVSHLTQKKNWQLIFNVVID